jgi:hypothetical protein
VGRILVKNMTVTFNLCITLLTNFNFNRHHTIRITNESFENLAKFKYLGTILTNHNDIHDEIKSRLNSGNA